MDRDDQCAPPSNWADLASNQNFNGSLCLKSTCTYANVTLGQTCILDDVTYIDLGPDGEQFSNSVTRHNCKTPQFYCDAGLQVCIPTKSLGVSCVCADPPETPRHVEVWQVVITTISILAAMCATVVVLTLVHKRLRLQRYRQIREYYEEQISLRKTLAALHAAAADRYIDEKGHYE
ncbi:hypothetical protein BN946_scf184746.g40 [Trametes cinnabarina]|uniref:Uncharacterized protein n=1 Tax=Pycnoporus cinnabarinus TaxID=5643 RepID=A0A060SAR2_PYCCI|nr:hypothetical protein BN946_scf184746.g40 [Trametes cinnabarina]